MNPKIPKLSQPQRHKGPNTSTNLETPKLGQPQYHQAPNASTSQNRANYNATKAQTPRRTTEHLNGANVNTTKCPTPQQPRNTKIEPTACVGNYVQQPCMLCGAVCSVARRDVGRLWAVKLLGEIGEFHVILPGNRRLTKISRCCLTRFTFVAVAYCIMSPALMYQFFSTQVSLRHHTLHIATLRLHTRNSMLLHLECN